MNGVDFTPILGLLIAVIPIILIVAVMAKFLKGKGGLTGVFLLLMLTFGLCIAPFIHTNSVMAAGALSPSSGTIMTDIPVSYTARGLTAGTNYWVNITVSGAVTNVVRAIPADSLGTLAFTITFTTEGSTTVDVRTISASVVSGTFNVVNFINMLMPYIVLFITISVLLGVAGLLTGLVSTRKR